MIGRVVVPMVALAMGLGAAAVSAQAGPPRQGGRGGGPMAMGVAAFALEQREPLALTEDQVTRLETARIAAETATRPVREKLEAARGTMQRGSGGNPQGREQMQGLMQEMRAALEPHDKAAMEVLTAEQQTRLAELRPQGRRRPPGR